MEDDDRYKYLVNYNGKDIYLISSMKLPHPQSFFDYWIGKKKFSYHCKKCGKMMWGKGIHFHKWFSVFLVYYCVDCDKEPKQGNKPQTFSLRNKVEIFC